MADVQTGLGIVYGIQGTITMTGVASFTLESAKATHNFEVDDMKDGTNFTFSTVAVDPSIELEVQWTPSGATRAAAHATTVFLDPLTKVTLAGFTATQFNGDYQYRSGGSIDLSKKEGKMSFKLKRWTDGTQNGLLTTTVTG